VINERYRIAVSLEELRTYEIISVVTAVSYDDDVTRRIMY
jgi:hypothetical protein